MGQVGAAANTVFGKRDPNATNDVMNGQSVATGTPGAVTMKDPNQGLNLGQRMARGAVQGGLQGLGRNSQYAQGPRPNSLFFGGGGY